MDRDTPINQAEHVRTIIRALQEVVDREMVPIGVAAVVDARSHAIGRSEHWDITFGAQRVPLISLATVDLKPDTQVEQDAIPIDPVLRRPAIGRPELPHSLIPQDAYVKALRSSDGTRLGHIERPANRHYTAYVDPTLLFRDQTWSQNVMWQLKARIHNAHATAFGGVSASAALCLLYPEGTADDLPTVTQLLGDTLRTSGLQVIDIVAVPRAPHGGYWRLPASLKLPEHTRHAVFVDSAANSGHTIRQLIRLAADAKVDAITGVMLLNGMSDSDALTLQQTATVHRSAAGDRTTPVPLYIYYVARTAMSHLDGRDCTVCQLRRRYQAIPLIVPVPTPLEQQREWLLRSLEPRTKVAAFQEQAIDLFGAHVSQADCEAYLRWRFELREAALDTTRRRQVFEKLTGAANDAVIRDALVRLLVAESHWLDSAPLWFADCRSLIADLAVSLLIGDAALFTDQMLRVQAVILLVNTDPGRFANELLRVVEANRHQAAVVLQVMLEVLRLITGPTAPRSYARDLVTQPLLQRLIVLESRLRDPGQAQYLEVVSLALVRYLLSHGRRSLQPLPTNPQMAWAALRDNRRLVDDHDYQSAMWRVLLSVGIIGRGEPPKDLDGIRDDWATCTNFLLLDVLPNVQLLRDPLLSKKVTNELGADDASRWQNVLNGQGPGSLDDITVRLDRLLSQIRPESSMVAYTVDKLLKDLRWWYRTFLQPSAAGAFLAQVVKRCPTDILDIIESTFQDTQMELGVASPDDHEEVPVFCTTRLLKDVLTHIRMNAAETHRIQGGAQRFRIDVSEPDSDYVKVTVRNTASRPSATSGGNGLRKLSDELNKFGGRLTAEDTERPWTYGISITLERWRMSS